MATSPLSAQYREDEYPWIVQGDLGKLIVDAIPGFTRDETSGARANPLAKSELHNQDRHWSRHAARYDELFLDPYGPDVENPLWEALAAVPTPRPRPWPTSAAVPARSCPTWPSGSTGSSRWILRRGCSSAPRPRLGPEAAARVTFLKRPMHDLDDLAGQLDVAVAVNSLVMPDVRLIDRTLRSIRASLRPGGQFMGVVPSIDAICYHPMLLLDQALDRGLEPKEAERLAALHTERRLLRFRFRGISLRGPAAEVLAALRDRVSAEQGRFHVHDPGQGPLSLG